MQVDTEVFARFTGEAGVEIFQVLLQRAEVLGNVPHQDVLLALQGALAVCLANVLRPSLEVAPNPASLAERLLEVFTKQSRYCVEQMLAEEG